MAHSSTVRGPSLMLYYGPGTGEPMDSGQFAWTRTRSKSTVSRVKPKGLDLLIATEYSSSDSFRERSMVNRSDGSYFPSPYNSAPEDFDNETYQSDRKAVVVKLRDKIKGEDWNLSTFVGELPETLAYFEKTLKTVVSTYRAVRRGDMRSVRKLRKNGRKTVRPGRLNRPIGHEETQRELSSRWLEWRYAIQPLMYDLDDMLKALANKAQIKPLWTRAVSGTQSKFRSRGRYGNAYGGIDFLRQHEMELRIGAYYRVNPDVQAFKRLGLLNPVATLWELFPLSFVVDWLIPIGQFLGSLDAMVGVQLLSSWESQTVKTEYTLTGGSADGESKTPDTSRKRYYNRFIAPDLSLPLPQFKLSLNSSRFLDGLALTRSILLSGK